MRVGIALGSNLGDREANLRAARDFLLGLHDHDSLPLVSPLYETAPIDCPPGSPAFLNAVMEIGFASPPEDLLARSAAFEQGLGRPALRGKNSPRPIDIDLLYAGDSRIDTAALVLPHPRLAVRSFVLRPLADILPDLVLPGHADPISKLLAGIPHADAVRMVASTW